MTNVECPHHGKPYPTNSVKNVYCRFQCIWIREHDFIHFKSLNQNGYKENLQTDFKPQSNEISWFGVKGPNNNKPHSFKELYKNKHRYLRIFGRVKYRQRDHHEKLFIVGHDMIIIGSEPMLHRPLFPGLRYNKNLTSYS